jgi:hypothetical protein
LRLAANVAGISGIAETDALIAENFLHLDSTIDSQVSFPNRKSGRFASSTARIFLVLRWCLRSLTGSGRLIHRVEPVRILIANHNFHLNFGEFELLDAGFPIRLAGWKSSH